MKKTILLFIGILNMTLTSVCSVATLSTAYFEAEEFTSQSECRISTSNFPYIGKGYLEMGGNGSYAEWNNINAPVTGKYTLIIKYANGSDANRQCELKINGTVVENIPFAPIYKNWKWYWNARVTVNLNRGSNTVRLTANTATGGPNIDNIAISSKALTEQGKRI